MPGAVQDPPVARVRARLTYANVMSTLAAFAALATGGAWAAATIGTSDIKDGAVTARKLHADAVVRSKIADGAVNGAKVADDSLGGTDINEAGLDPSVLQRRISQSCASGHAIRAVAATGAVTCQAVGGSGSGVTAFDVTAPESANRQVSIRGVTIQAVCSEDGATIRIWNVTGGAGALYWSYDLEQWGGVNGVHPQIGQGFVGNGSYAQFPMSSYGLSDTYDGRLQGSFIFKGPTETVSIELHASELSGDYGCLDGADAGGVASYAPTAQGVAGG